MRTNCVNCGAAIDPVEVKCPFCGTTYFDLTAIDFASDAPTVLKLRIPTAKGNLIFSMLAKPKLGTIDHTETYTDVRGRYGENIGRISASRDVEVGLTFNAVQPKQETSKLFGLRLE